MTSYEYMAAFVPNLNDFLEHHGIMGQKWYYRRFQNKDGSLTAEGYAIGGLVGNPDVATGVGAGIGAEPKSLKRRNNVNNGGDIYDD